MLQPLSFLGLFGAALASTTALTSRQVNPSDSCLSLRNSCYGATVDLTNFYNYPACIMFTTCTVGIETPAQVLALSQAPANQPRLTEVTFNEMTGGNASMTQQNYIDAYYHEISVTPGGIYPANIQEVIDEWAAIAAWAGFCDTLDLPYNNFADWLEYSSSPDICPAVASCNAAIAATAIPCVSQPLTDNGSCAEIVKQCQLWVTGENNDGLFQNEYCVLASFCYAFSNTDVLLQHEYPSSISPTPTTAQQARLSQDVFYDMTGCSPTMSLQNVMDAYYGALTGTWVSRGGTFGAEKPYKTTKNGPYPSSSQFVIDFWTAISAWTGFCDSREIPYSDLADYLSYAAGSGYHPTC